MSGVRIERFAPGRESDFERVHSDANGAGWCRCVAWWVPTWEGWGDRTAEQNAVLRNDLCRRGEHDGLLAYDGDTPIGWCQVGPRDRLSKLVAQLELTPDASVWAATCFVVAPPHRGRGVARALLDGAVGVARAAGGSRIEGYPRTGGSDPGDQWTGPRGMFIAAGFSVVREGSPRSVLALELRG